LNDYGVFSDLEQAITIRRIIKAVKVANQFERTKEDFCSSSYGKFSNIYAWITAISPLYNKISYYVAYLPPEVIIPEINATNKSKFRSEYSSFRCLHRIAQEPPGLKKRYYKIYVHLGKKYDWDYVKDNDFIT